MANSSDASQAVRAISSIEAVPAMLETLCEISGLRLAMVAHVEGKVWTVCAVRDELGLGIAAGGPLVLKTNLDMESQPSRTPLVIEQAGVEAQDSAHDPPGTYRVESYVSVPVFLPSGSYFGVLCALDPGRGNLGQPGVVSIFKRFASIIASQLSQQLKTDHERNALLDERASGELREQFIAILGHDLRTPLQAVLASSDILQRKLEDPDLSEIAARIKTNVRRMSSLIDDVLDFARARLGGGIPVELTDVEDINVGLTAVIQELQDAQSGIKIVSSINVTRSVRGDLGKLQQVASNLLANAVTHGLPHSTIEISARADEADFVLEVWNAGEPIPVQSLDKIFEPFWRHSVSASRQGLGLGLHICAQIVRAHGGRMTVTSTRENGTRFTARLPLCIPTAPLSAEAPDSADHLRTEYPLRQSGADGRSISQLSSL